jgi:hypothetical protein
MTNTLVAPTNLADFPGAPFSDALVDAAVSAVRGEAGWHIAPAVTETVVVESDGGAYLFLPTLQLTAVTAVRNVTDEDATPTTVTGWRSHNTARFRAGLLHRPAGWARGVFEVDITHGYAACPDDLLPVLAEVARAFAAGGRAIQESRGPYSVTWQRDNSTALAKYKIPARP